MNITRRSLLKVAAVVPLAPILLKTAPLAEAIAPLEISMAPVSSFGSILPGVERVWAEAVWREAKSASFMFQEEYENEQR